MLSNTKDEVFIKENLRLADIAMCEFLDKNREYVKKHSRHPHHCVTMKDGRTIYFLTVFEYDTWCKGRTYRINGKLFHSGYPVEKGEK